VRVLATETALGTKKLPVSQLFRAPELIEKTGISHVYEAEESTVSLASRACEQIDGLIARSVRLCIMVTQTPDDYLPANSIILADRIGLNKTCLAFDLNQGCSGFVQALCYAEKLLDSYGEILIVTADRYRSKLAKGDRSTNAVFSDGASATLCAKDEHLGLIYEDHYTDGSKRCLLFQSASNEENDGCLHMAGAEVWMFTRLNVVPQIKKAIEFCAKNKLEIGNIYIHQASKVVVEGIKSLLPVDPEKVVENYHRFGNTVSSTIPFLIKDYPLLMPSDRAVNILAGFGVGLTSSVVVYGRKN